MPTTLALDAVDFEEDEDDEDDDDALALGSDGDGALVAFLETAVLAVGFAVALAATAAAAAAAALVPCLVSSTAAVRGSFGEATLVVVDPGAGDGSDGVGDWSGAAT